MYIRVSIQENNYKIISWWYHTPFILHRFDTSTSDKCWKCLQATGDLLHIWWSFQHIQTYWKQVHNRIKKITTCHLEFTPAQFLLHHHESNDAPYHKSLVMMLVNAAKMCIPKLWGTPRVPSMLDWYKRINKITETEELISILMVSR